MNTSIPNPLQILLVEDNPGDVLLIEEALRDQKHRIRLHVVRHGEEAMDFLQRRGCYADAPRPDLILLDFNLPRKDGREVLAEIRTDPSLQHLPVIVLTTSQGEEDILKAYSLNATCYVPKPMDFDEFIEVIRSIESFWSRVAKLPDRTAP